MAGNRFDTHPYFRGLRGPIHIAHRGGAKLYPENTLLAFERAVRLHRTDVLELDVHATRDGEVVVSHDDTVDRCTDGTGPIASYTWQDLQRLDAGFCTRPAGLPGMPFRGQGVRIPSLRQVLRAFPDTRINVDLKTPAVVEPFLALIRAERCLDRVVMGSEDDALAARLVEALPGAAVFYPRDAATSFVVAVHSGQPLPEEDRYLVLDMPLTWEGTTVFTSAVASAARQRGKWVNVWTVDDAAEMRFTLAAHVDGIMTDRPDVLRTVLEERKRVGRRCDACHRLL